MIVWLVAVPVAAILGAYALGIWLRRNDRVSQRRYIRNVGIALVIVAAVVGLLSQTTVPSFLRSPYTAIALLAVSGGGYAWQYARAVGPERARLRRFAPVMFVSLGLVLVASLFELHSH